MRAPFSAVPVIVHVAPHHLTRTWNVPVSYYTRAHTRYVGARAAAQPHGSRRRGRQMNSAHSSSAPPNSFRGWRLVLVACALATLTGAPGGALADAGVDRVLSVSRPVAVRRCARRGQHELRKQFCSGHAAQEKSTVIRFLVPVARVD